MNKINSLGMELLKYKEELIKDTYPEIVRESLIFALDEKCKVFNVGADINLAIKDKDLSYNELYENLKCREAYLKTEEELKVEYDVILNELQEKILALGELKNIECESVPSSESIKIRKIISFGKDFIERYFAIDEIDEDKRDDSICKMMKKNGIFGKFAVLRFTRILKDFLKEYEYSTDLMTCYASYVYADSMNEEDIKSYNIDLTIKLNIDILENPDNLETISNEVFDIICNVEAYFDNKCQ